jgi:hypothetical protein
MTAAGREVKRATGERKGRGRREHDGERARRGRAAVAAPSPETTRVGGEQLTVPPVEAHSPERPEREDHEEHRPIPHEVVLLVLRQRPHMTRGRRHCLRSRFSKSGCPIAELPQRTCSPPARPQSDAHCGKVEESGGRGAPKPHFCSNVRATCAKAVQHLCGDGCVELRAKTPGEICTSLPPPSISSGTQ